MDERLSIESLQNPRVKNAVRLRRRKVRMETRTTLVEGYREIQRAVANHWSFIELYYCPELFIDPGSSALVSGLQHSGLPAFSCTPDVFRKISYRDTPDGLIALSPLVGCSLDEIKLPPNPLILITQNLEKPGNLGTMLRTADAAGVDAVVVCDGKTDLNNPNTIRSSIGTLFFLPVAEASTDEMLVWLQANGIRLLAALPDADELYTEVDMRAGMAIAVGSEDCGLTSSLTDQAAFRVRIPMLGTNDSLNVSTAAAILLYEARRQRITQ